MKNWKLGLVLVLGLLIAQHIAHSQILHSQAQRSTADNKYLEWRSYGGSPENTHYSALQQINRGNVKRLEIAWTYDTRDAFEGSELQCNPIVINDVLFGTSPKLRVFALEAATGKELWSFDPNEGRRSLGKVRNRGLNYWEGDGEQRLFFADRNWLYSLDARTGKPVKAFGENGRVDLREGLGRDANSLSVGLSTPGVVYKDLLIIGSIVSETLPAAPGDIRAYDVRTGKLQWTFHTIPHPGEFGYQTWPKNAWQYSGGANAWSGLTLDEKRGLVFAATGSATFDFYGANRHGDNLFANSLICLDATTGKRKWHFQSIRHDMWDRDLPSAPSLVTIKRNRRKIDAIAQITKSGHIFVFERVTGKPVFPIEYRKVSTQGIDGEQPADTQPVPTLPPPVARQILTEQMLTRRTPEAHAAALEQFRKLRGTYEWGQFEPPTTKGTIVFPGFDGGPGWGGAAFDPETGLFFVNSSEVPCILRLVERPKARALPSGKSLYDRNCASCHSKDLTGTPPEFPSLVNISKKYNDSELRTMIRTGFGRMPGFASLGNAGIRAVTQYLLSGEDIKAADEQHAVSLDMDLKYTIDGYTRFLDPDGYPAVEPPWGTLNAVDLNKGKIVWQIPLGEHPELVAKGLRDTGSWNYGGPIVTAGGVVFIGATNYDKKFRAFDKATGKLLWESLLPAAGNATPMTYQIGGRQFVVIAAGGGKRGAPSGGTYVAFALPPNQ
ncbi:MAG: PQQ-binding-like beta-propeller repeat protein [Blastocatellales bacterium]